MDVKNLVKQFICTEILYEQGDIRLEDTTPLLDEGIIDSLGIMKLLPYLEETFSIRVSEEELTPENFENVHAISLLVGKKTKSL